MRERIDEQLYEYIKTHLSLGNLAHKNGFTFFYQPMGLAFVFAQRFGRLIEVYDIL
jgi:hypothetical protein